MFSKILKYLVGKKVMDQKSVVSLQSIKNKIENMNKNQQLDILKILYEEENVKLNENKSGVYVNLTFLSSSVLEKITNYLVYVGDQEENLTSIEEKKNMTRQQLFNSEGI
tara:strand:+ start:200 stop:529 length:330 start_codon:yes stop_codon:yes gene_type:complete